MTQNNSPDKTVYVRYTTGIDFNAADDNGETPADLATIYERAEAKNALHAAGVRPPTHTERLITQLAREHNCCTIS